MVDFERINCLEPENTIEVDYTTLIPEEEKIYRVSSPEVLYRMIDGSKMEIVLDTNPGNPFDTTAWFLYRDQVIAKRSASMFDVSYHGVYGEVAYDVSLPIGFTQYTDEKIAGIAIGKILNNKMGD